jgi:DNA polymerase III alpha subunit
VELLLGPDDEQRLVELRELSRRTAIPLVACGDVPHAQTSALQDTLTAIRLRRRCANSAMSCIPMQNASCDRSTCWRNHPPELLAGTLSIVERCNFLWTVCDTNIRKRWCRQARPRAAICKLTEEGLEQRFPWINPAAAKHGRNAGRSSSTNSR